MLAKVSNGLKGLASRQNNSVRNLKIGKRPLEALCGNSQPIQVFDSGNIEAFELDSMPIDHFAQYRDRFTAPLPFDCH